MGVALGGLVGGLLATGVAHVRTAVVPGVGVEDFAVVARLGDAQPIPFADNGSGVEHDDDQIAGMSAAAHEAEDTVVSIVGVNPLEAVPVKFHLMKRRLRRVE